MFARKNKKSSSIIILGIVAAVVLTLIGLGVWLFGHIKRVPHAEILPPTAFAFFTIDLDPESSGFSDLIDKAEGVSFKRSHVKGHGFKTSATPGK